MSASGTDVRPTRKQQVVSGPDTDNSLIMPEAPALAGQVPPSSDPPTVPVPSVPVPPPPPAVEPPVEPPQPQSRPFLRSQDRRGTEGAPPDAASGAKPRPDAAKPRPDA